jgi:hypothetical protein
MFAYDALIYQNYELEAKAKGTPLDYIFTQLDVIQDGWDSVLAASSQFLSSFVSAYRVPLPMNLS